MLWPIATLRQRALREGTHRPLANLAHPPRCKAALSILARVRFRSTGRWHNPLNAQLVQAQGFEAHPHWRFTTAIISITPMQLDIFEHSRDVVLRNAVIDALRERDTGACAQALAALAAECGADTLLPAFRILCKKLHSPIPKPLAREVAIAVLEELDDAIAPAAHAVFGKEAQAWLSPLCAELAASIADYPFDSGHESLHAAPLLLHAGRWMEASACIEAIASWRRQPAPLAWMIEARCHTAGFNALMPLLAELAWMAPQRAQVLAPRLELPALDRLVRNFDAEFEGAGTPDDFTWFPAWALIADSRLEAYLRLSQAGANTRAEYCARIVLDLLLFERQGRHAELIESRRKLRELHPALFARYMQGR